MKQHPPEVRARAAELRAQGMGYNRIARTLGVGTSTVIRWLDPAYAERQLVNCRARKLLMRGTCRICGDETRPRRDGTGANDRCASCIAAEPMWPRWAIDHLVRCYQRGEGMTRFCGRVGLPKNAANTLAGHIERVTTLRPHRRGSWTRLPVADVVAAYEAGESAHLIAARYGAHSSSVIFQLQGAGVQLRTRGEAQVLRHRRERAQRVAA